GAREAPHLLRIGLEEREEQTSPEPIRDPVLERVLVPVREELPLDVAQDDAEALPGPQAAQGVHGPEGIVEEPSLVIDAGQTRAADEIFAEDLVPQLVDLLHLAEEPVTAEVEVEAVVVLGASEPAHGVGFLQDGRPEIEPAQLTYGR